MEAGATQRGEAYFGLNDYYPFEKNDLQQYDSVAYAMVELVWEK